MGVGSSMMTDGFGYSVDTIRIRSGLWLREMAVRRYCEWNASKVNASMDVGRRVTRKERGVLAGGCLRAISCRLPHFRENRRLIALLGLVPSPRTNTKLDQALCSPQFMRTIIKVKKLHWFRGPQQVICNISIASL